MDKRSIATRNKIKKTYVDMLVSGQKVNVRALVRLAKINKSTFYRYYTYLDELEDELVMDIAKETYEACKNDGPSSGFATKFFNYYENLGPRKKALFNSNINKTTTFLANFAMEDYKKKHTDQIKILLLYIISVGCIGLFIDKKYPREDKKAAIIKIAEYYRQWSLHNEEES